MPAAPLPPDETERLAMLDTLHLLDTPPEPVFDRVTRLACRLLDVPMAMFSLVGADRQWCKSRVGIEAVQMPREHAFCAHAIGTGAPLVVTDAREDGRFRDNPLVRGAPSVRFYAGVPVRSSAGLAIGTLCALDTRPRTLGEEEARVLDDLAALLSREVQYRERSAELLEARARLGESMARQRALELALEAREEELGKNREDRHAYDSRHDQLTGLPNRRALLESIPQAQARANRSGKTMGMLFIDLDGFKAVNESQGHEAGDILLGVIAERLRSGVRKTDSVFRLAGDEFTVLLEDIADTFDDAHMVAEKLIDSIAEPVELPGRAVRVRASIGIALDAGAAGRPSRSPDELLKEADHFMSQAKKSGRGRVCSARRPC